MGNPRCKWVRDRLPLLAGDDLRGLDRRRAERHLIGCSHCRQHQAALGRALETLRTVATIPPVPPDAPSLWPALARQIRESRRPVPAPAFPFSFPPSFAWLRIHPWPALGLGLGLGVLAALGVGLGVRQQIATAQADISANALPLTRAFAPPGAPRAAEPALVPWDELPAPAETTTVESTPAHRGGLDHDLEYGRPMPPPLPPAVGETRDTRTY